MPLTAMRTDVNLSFLKIAAAGVVSTCLALMATAANAEVNWSVNVGVPGVVVTEPAPVYVAPEPVYAPPPPVYYRPAPAAYYRAPPAYYAPAPVYEGPAYYDAPPAPVYYRRGEWRHRHHERGDDDRD